jgi:hypothetical protein
MTRNRGFRGAGGAGRRIPRAAARFDAAAPRPDNHGSRFAEAAARPEPTMRARRPR